MNSLCYGLLFWVVVLCIVTCYVSLLMLISISACLLGLVALDWFVIWILLFPVFMRYFLGFGRLVVFNWVWLYVTFTDVYCWF